MGLAATLAFAESATKWAPTLSQVDALALWIFDCGHSAERPTTVERMVAEQSRTHTAAQCLAFMVTHLARRQDHVETLKAAHWMQFFRYRDLLQAIELKDLKRHRPRPTRQKMSSDKFHELMFDLVEYANKKRLARRRWTGEFERQLARTNIQLSQKSIRSYLNEHYPKRSGT